MVPRTENSVSGGWIIRYLRIWPNESAKPRAYSQLVPSLKDFESGTKGKPHDMSEREEITVVFLTKWRFIKYAGSGRRKMYVAARQLRTQALCPFIVLHTKATVETTRSYT